MLYLLMYVRNAVSIRVSRNPIFLRKATAVPSAKLSVISRALWIIDVLIYILYSAQVAPECVTKFNELKLSKKIKFIIYKLSDDYKEIVVEEASEDGDWELFREKLISATSKSKTVLPNSAVCKSCL